MDCSEAFLLVEKLVDGEATDRERSVAEAHVDRCERCRAHKEFLERVATAARTLKLESPPDSYWNALPRKVIDRIQGVAPRGSFVSGGAVRFAALAASAVVAIAVGIYVASRGELEPPPPSESVLEDQIETVVTLEGEVAEEARARRESASPPPMARDETASAPETVASLDQEMEMEKVPRLSPQSPAEPVAGANAEAMEMPVAPQSLLVAEADVGRASRAGQTRDCAALRDRLTKLDEPHLTEGRYQLALCTLERYTVEPTQELREIATRDAESFLAVETESPRAFELREALTRIQ